MTRLISFGCSFTFGQHLPDNINTDIPSEFAYPAVLGKLLNLEAINKGSNGSGNLQILYDIINFEFLPNDIVTIGWSYFSRFDQLQFINYTGHTKIYSKESMEHKRNIIDSLYGKNEYIESNIFFKNWFAIHHAHCYLSSKGIKNYQFDMVINDSTFSNIKKPKFIDFDFINLELFYRDTAADHKHPGPKTHAYYAEQLYNYINVH